jgi:uncharacterized membrane protein
MPNLRPVLALAAIALPAAVVADRALASRRGPRPLAPLRMLEVVDAPIEATWAILSDIPLQPAWMTEMKTVRLLTPGPVSAGTRGEATVRILGISVTDEVTVTEFEPPVRFGVRHEGLVTGGGELRLEAGADGTTTIVRWAETLVAPFLPDLAAAVAGPILRAVFQADLRRLKALVEAPGIE